jgi:trehalose synthase
MHKRKLRSYRKVVGGERIDELYELSERLEDARIHHINSTSVGGGVAELLNRLIPLFNEVGVEARWDVIKGGEDFFHVTKKIHNALHGSELNLDGKACEVYQKTNRLNAEEIDFTDGYTVVHDPQPAALVETRGGREGAWIWRCHIDVSKPHYPVWKFLRKYVNRYDASIYSMQRYTRGDINTRQFLIPPSIDPLDDKNRELSEDEIAGVLDRHGIRTDKPLITQVSRFDRLKDPSGVIEAYRMVKRHCDCQLLLAGGAADDDPEGVGVYRETVEKAGEDLDIHISAGHHTNVEINAFQRASAVIVQKSLKEGFGLTVTEALWKGKPVVASAVGGIPLQITNNHTGFLVHSVEGTAQRIRQILHNPQAAKMVGSAAREHVRNNFLVTRHLKDYLILMHAVRRKSNVIQL